MSRRILLIDGHPDPAGGHLCQALLDAYAEGAQAGGHAVRRIVVAGLDFPLLRTREAWAKEAVPAALKPCQEAIAWADHLVLIYPLWLGTMPALFKGFLEQVLRPGFAVAAEGSTFDAKLGGRSARVVVTMGMPAFVYRWVFGAHSLKSLERNILRFCGIRPIRETLIGSVETVSPRRRQGWFAAMRAAGSRGI